MKWFWNTKEIEYFQEQGFESVKWIEMKWFWSTKEIEYFQEQEFESVKWSEVKWNEVNLKWSKDQLNAMEWN
jgi:N-acetylglutamate synthase-like GNAT family acetyltransferase